MSAVNPTEPKGIDSPKLSIFPPLPPPVPDWKEVVDAIQNTEYAIGHIRAHMQALTEGERRSLFRAVLDVDAKVGTPEGIGGETALLEFYRELLEEAAPFLACDSECDCAGERLYRKIKTVLLVGNRKPTAEEIEYGLQLEAELAKNPTPEPLGEPAPQKIATVIYDNVKQEMRVEHEPVLAKSEEGESAQ